MRVLMMILLLLLLLLQYKLWLAPGNILELKRFDKNIAHVDAVSKELQKQNQVTEKEINDLKHGNDAIEERARTDLGMIKEGEVFYQLIEEKNINDGNKNQSTQSNRNQ